jgi:hypothetical protein
LWFVNLEIDIIRALLFVGVAASTASLDWKLCADKIDSIETQFELIQELQTGRGQALEGSASDLFVAQSRLRVLETSG